MPTFQNLRRGGGNIAAIPGKKFGAPKPNFQNTYRTGSKPFRSDSFSNYQNNLGDYNNTVSGVTKDSSSVILGSCTVKLYRTSDDVEILTTVSDAITGVYTFYNVSAGPFYVVAYKAGAPDVAGTTVNTLTAV